MKRLYWFLIRAGIIFPKILKRSRLTFNQIKVINRRKILEKYYYFSLIIDKNQYQQFLEYHFGPFPDILFPLLSISLMILSPLHFSCSHNSAILVAPVLYKCVMRHSQAVPAAWNSIFQIASWLMPSLPWRDLLWPYYLKFKFVTSTTRQHS